jgi:hypothetical protein
MITESSPQPTSGITTWNDGVSGMTTQGRANAILSLALKAKLRGLFDSTDFVVEADEFARFQLNIIWRHRVKWDFDPRCYTVNVGTFAGYPVNICLQFAMLNGKRIMFYSPSSQIVNYEMIDKWLLAYCNPTRHAGLDRAHVNAQNFHQVIEFCRSR